MHIDLYLGVLQFEGSVRDDSGLVSVGIEDGLFGSFPRTFGCTAVELIDERAVLIIGAVVVVAAGNEVPFVLRVFVEPVARFAQTGYGDVHIALVAGLHHESFGFLMGSSLVRVTIEVNVQDRRNHKGPLCPRRFKGHFPGVFFGLRYHVGRSTLPFPRKQLRQFIFGGL